MGKWERFWNPIHWLNKLDEFLKRIVKGKGRWAITRNWQIEILEYPLVKKARHTRKWKKGSWSETGSIDSGKYDDAKWYVSFVIAHRLIEQRNELT